MNKRLMSSFALAITLMMALSILAPLRITKATPTITIYFDPHPYEFTTAVIPSAGARFNVTIWVVSDTDFNLMMWEVRLFFNPSIIDVAMEDGIYRVWPQDALGGRNFDPDYVFYGEVGGMTTTPNKPSTDSILAGDLLMGDITIPADTPKKLCVVEFEVKQIPEKGGELYCDLAINNDETYLYDSTGPILAGPDPNIHDSWYKLTWAPPPSPYLDVVRADGQPWPLVFERWFEVVGETFDVDIYIKELAEAWGLHNATLVLNYDETLINATGVTIHGTWTTATSDISVPGVVQIFVEEPAATPSGDVKIATITFEVIYQGTYPEVDETDIVFDDTLCELFDHIMEISIDWEKTGKGTVIIEGYMPAPSPYLEVDPSEVVLGPEPAVGTEFEVAVKVNRLYELWKAIGYEFRLTYQWDLLEVVNIKQGGFFNDSRWNWYGTFFVSKVEPYPTSVVVACLLLPNASGVWDQTMFPNTEVPDVDNTLAIIRFKAIKQLWGEDFWCKLEIQPLSEVFLDVNGNYIPTAWADCIHGNYTILGPRAVGRVIDVYGGANNAGYWTGYPNPFPDPYGGQGPNNPMDLVIPQSEVTLYAKVTYNYYPVQSKIVSFEVEGPFENCNGELEPKSTYKVIYKGTAITNSDGIANISFAMPWPCSNPEDYLGVYKVTATVDIRDVVVNDTMLFYYDYMVHILSVTTDKYHYAHTETVTVTVKYATHAMQKYPALFTAVLKDELNVLVDMDLRGREVGGAEFCEFLEDTITLKLKIPKWAFTGYANIYVNVFDKDPTEGGFAWCPEYGPVEICIEPS